MICGRNRFSCSSKYIHMHNIYMSVVSQQKKTLDVIHHYVHCSLQLSLELESFYLPVMKLYGFIYNSALWGSPYSRQIFFRLILISLLAHACSINGDMISLRDMKTTASSLPLQTVRGEFRFPKPQNSLWSPGKQAILSSKGPDLTQTHCLGPKHRPWARKSNPVEQAAHSAV